jgi:predicted ATP-grasp superfamily ATP-dependent carboligase
MIQEYVPGKERPSIYLMIDKRGVLKIAFCSRLLRGFPRTRPIFSMAGEVVAPYSDVMHAARLVEKLGWWGSTTVQTKMDARDSIPKLMEINPRLGHHLWYRTELGINEPLMCLQIARAETAEAVKEYPIGTMLLNPIEDMLSFALWLLDLMIYKFRMRFLGKSPIDRATSPMNVEELIQSYKQTYLNGNRKVLSPYFRYFFQDPLVSILWWGQFCTLLFRGARQLGR